MTEFLVSLTEDPTGKKGEAEATVEEAGLAEAASTPSVTHAHIMESMANKARDTAKLKGRIICGCRVGDLDCKIWVVGHAVREYDLAVFWLNHR